jgi:hypothetical protein
MVVIGAAMLSLLLLVPPMASAAPEPVVPRPEPVEDVLPTSLIPIPFGCPAPDRADVAFVGTVLAKDEFVEKGTVRYRIDQVRAGSAAPFAVDGQIDVRYGPDSQFLDVDSTYLVSAAFDNTIAALASKIAAEPPLFGGDAVVGLEDTETDCPVIDDPVMTIDLDGTPVESGLLAPLVADRRVLLSTIGVPVAVVAAVLIGLVLLRMLLSIGLRGVFALGRAAVTPSTDHRAARVRRHLADEEAARLFPDDGSFDDDHRTNHHRTDDHRTDDHRTDDDRTDDDEFAVTGH